MSSTEHIRDELDVAVQAALSAEAKNKAERKRLRRQQKQADKAHAEELRGIEALKRAVEQRYNDEAEPRDRALAQVNFIADAVKPEPETPTPEPVTPVVATPEPGDNPSENEKKELLAENQELMDGPPAVVEVPTPEPVTPVVATPEPGDDDEPQAEPNRLQQAVQTAKDHTQLSNLQFGLAFVGLLIGLVLYSQWPGWATRNIENDLGWVTVGLLWFVGHVGLGAFVGGLLGTVLDKGKKDS